MVTNAERSLLFVLQWTVETLENGNYKLQNRGALVGGAFGHLFAFPAPELAGGATTQWTFKRDELNKDPNAFMYVSRLRS